MSKILVVEDDPETLDVVTLTLELRGYEVVVAKNGMAGIDTACAALPDLIVTDIMMPKLDGLGMIRQLRARPDCARVPILVITAHDADFAPEAILAGASRVLPKPIHPDTLLAAVRNLLRPHR